MQGQTFVALYASRVEFGLPCPDARGRCAAAMKIARKSNGIIVIGVGSVCGVGPPFFSEVLERYLVQQGWPKERILINPLGWGTIAESKAAYEAIQRAGGGDIVAVSAWYHIIRIWLIWAVVLKRFVRVRVSWKTYPWTNPFREVVQFPLTLCKIMRSRK